MSKFENLSPEDQEYILNLPYHLAQASIADDLYELLTEFEFIEQYRPSTGDRNDSRWAFCSLWLQR
ncbi:MAG: hypothetical protein SAK29_10110 [Scytonema sp. PMC 1069.18]|nr:hypothetical protein [Scytonema sp. PMC 1069.18]MEC4886016.1 hypothetical protein [Scytonema sp. PMC 1070.18]